jgi:hypothetical protein
LQITENGFADHCRSTFMYYSPSSICSIYGAVLSDFVNISNICQIFKGICGYSFKPDDIMLSVLRLDLSKFVCTCLISVSE